LHVPSAHFTWLAGQGADGWPAGQSVSLARHEPSAHLAGLSAGHAPGVAAPGLGHSGWLARHEPSPHLTGRSAVHPAATASGHWPMLARQDLSAQRKGALAGQLGVPEPAAGFGQSAALGAQVLFQHFTWFAVHTTAHSV
jgi:hypothetical protein